ncbi:GtrA-like protein [Ruegeria meonggei]|uniref:GtrA-like protein n=2 Tax=Ruegeria meonggei TaxID=1446476 RepID=A0A1X7ACC8_9RHOB|nr:GtrA-like protein [Ruegeria meonggei]
MKSWEMLPPKLRQFVLYVLCGGGGAALDFVLYAFLVTTGVWHHAANVAGYASGTLLSFALNRVITFRVLDAPIRRLAAFMAFAGIGYLCSMTVLIVLVDALSVDPVMAKAASVVVVVAVQYTLNSRITFQPTGSQRKPHDKIKDV